MENSKYTAKYGGNFLPGSWHIELRSVRYRLPVCFDLVRLHLRSHLVVLCLSLFGIITELPSGGDREAFPYQLVAMQPSNE